MDLYKHSECLKYYLARLSMVECSEKPEKESTGKHPDFFLLQGFMVFACVNVLTINLSFNSRGRPLWGHLRENPAPLPLLKRFPFFFLPVQETAAMRTLCGAQVHPLKTSNITNEKQTYYLFLGRANTQKQCVLLKIRNNCTENCSQFQWRWGGCGGGNIHLLL